MSQRFIWATKTRFKNLDSLITTFLSVLKLRKLNTTTGRRWAKVFSHLNGSKELFFVLSKRQLKMRINNWRDYSLGTVPEGAGRAHPDGVAQRDFVAAHLVELSRHCRHLARGHLTLVGTSHHTGHIASEHSNKPTAHRLRQLLLNHPRKPVLGIQN